MLQGEEELLGQFLRGKLLVALLLCRDVVVHIGQLCLLMIKNSKKTTLILIVSLWLLDNNFGDRLSVPRLGSVSLGDNSLIV